MACHAKGKCSPTTFQRYGQLADYAKRYIGETVISELEPMKIEEALNDLKKRGGQKGRPLSPNTVRNVGFVIHVALEKAVRWGVLDANPMNRVDLPKKLKKPVAVLDKARLSLFFAGAKGTRLYPFLILAAATGCRRGELLALLWDDLDLTTRVLTVSKSLEETQAGLRVKSTKSGKERRLKVPEFAIEALLEHKKEQDRDKELYGESYQDHGLTFCRPEGEYYTPDKVTARVTELARKLGFPKGITLHVLRHSHASQLLSKKTPIPVVSKRLGHANPNITLLIYAHALEEDEAQAAETWNEVFSGAESKV